MVTKQKHWLSTEFGISSEGSTVIIEDTQILSRHGVGYPMVGFVNELEPFSHFNRTSACDKP